MKMMATGGIAIDALHPGTTIVVHTSNSCYRFVILHDPAFVLVKGGTMFPDATAVRYDGATAGSDIVKRRCIVVGLSMVMAAGAMRITSSPVRSVAIETTPATDARRNPAIN
jgi:hypothetical protein